MMINKIFKILLLLSIIPASILVYNEVLYFTGWKDNVSTPNNKAPIHFYVINLDRQPERFIQFKEQADKFGIDLERISATDGYKTIFIDQDTQEVFTGAEIKNKSKTFIAKHKYDVYCSSESYSNKEPAEFVYQAFQELNRGLTAGEIGLTCSYRTLWKQIINNPDDQIAVIFEDDAVLLDHFDQTISEFIKLLPNKWDIAYLDADVCPLMQIKLKNIRDVNDLRWKLNFPDLIKNNYFIKIHPHTNVQRTHGFVINKESAKKLLSIQENINSTPIDTTIAIAIQKRLITSYIAKNKLVSYDEKLESEISTMGRKEFGN